MNHYCTYFDRGYLIQGLALWRSLAVHDPDAVLWVLALDEFTAAVLREIGGTWLQVVPLTRVERDDPELAAAKANRTPAEYCFTLSPCWPRWLLGHRPEIDRITYLDADMLFFAAPTVMFEALEAAEASVLVTAHRFPSWLRRYERHGLYNVGVLSFRNNPAGRACLDDWRTRCLAWCYDRFEPGRYADQKYLDEWPARLGSSLLVCDDPGVNCAPWNWAALPCEVTAGGVRIDGRPLVLFHFARFRPLRGDRWWQSGQLEYGVMPHHLRQALYGPYWRALRAARAEIAARRPGFDFAHRAPRLDGNFWRMLPWRGLCGSDWVRVGDRFWSLRLGFGRWSGRLLAALSGIRQRLSIR